MLKKTMFATDVGDRRSGWIVRFSAAGVVVEAVQPPEAGKPVTLWSELDGDEGELMMTGSVKWASRSQFAVRFGPLGVRATRAILRMSRADRG